MLSRLHHNVWYMQYTRSWSYIAVNLITELAFSPAWPVSMVSSTQPCAKCLAPYECTIYRNCGSTHKLLSGDLVECLFEELLRFEVYTCTLQPARTVNGGTPSAAASRWLCTLKAVLSWFWGSNMNSSRPLFCGCCNNTATSRGVLWLESLRRRSSGIDSPPVICMYQEVCT